MMTLHSKRPLALATLAAATLLFVAACNQNAAGDKADAAKPADAKTADADAIPGLKDEKERISYMIGMDIGKTLEQVKGEVDVATMEKALRTSLEGGKPLMTEEQAAKVREAFAQKIQAKRIAEQMQAASKNQKDGAAFLATNGKKPGVQTTASGLQYQVVTAGTGPKPKESDFVRVHYTGTLLDGTKFDSSLDRGEPATIPLQQVVPGWREGIQLMPVGSKYRFWIPGNLAYGEAGTPGGPIGPNAMLAFEVELLGIEKPGAAPAGPAR